MAIPLVALRARNTAIYWALNELGAATLWVCLMGVPADSYSVPRGDL